MKTTKKALLLALCAVLLVVASVLGTIAYFTDSEAAKNTFTVGKVDIKLDEAPVDANGKATTGDRVKANTYNDIVPGGSYDKDPTVTVLADSEDCYVRAMITLTEAKAIHDLPAAYAISNWFDLNQNWEVKNVTRDETADTYTYELWYKTKVTGVSETEDTVLPKIFTKVTVPGEITNTELASLEGLQITVVAHAIQAAGFADADAAWAAWKN